MLFQLKLHTFLASAMGILCQKTRTSCVSVTFPTWTPPTPMTYRSCAMKSAASRFISVVPDRLRRSENRLRQTNRQECVYLFLHQTDILMLKCLVCPVNRLCCLSREWVHPGIRQIPKLDLCQNTSCKFSGSQVLTGYVCGVCRKGAVIVTKYLRNILRALTNGHYRQEEKEEEVSVRLAWKLGTGHDPELAASIYHPDNLCL